MTEPGYLTELRRLDAEIAAAPWRVETAESGQPRIAYNAQGFWERTEIGLLLSEGDVDLSWFELIVDIRNVVHDVLDSGASGGDVADQLMRLDAMATALQPGRWTSVIEGRDVWGADSVIAIGSETVWDEELYVRVTPWIGDRDRLLKVEDFLALARTRLPDLAARIRARL